MKMEVLYMCVLLCKLLLVRVSCHSPSYSHFQPPMIQVHSEFIHALFLLTEYFFYSAGHNDYSSVNTQIMLEACHNRACVEIHIVNDELVEGNETFTVELSDLHSNDSRVILSPVQAQVTINDDDDGTFKVYNTGNKNKL